MGTKTPPSASILVIDDEKKLNDLLSRILSLEGYKVVQAYTAKEGLRILHQEQVVLVISDVKLPDANGVELVKAIKQIKPFVEVINLTAYGTIADGVQAIQNGAFNYITKGDDNDRIIPLVSQAFNKAMHQLEAESLKNKSNTIVGFDNIIGTSPSITNALTLAKKVASTDTTVLLLGETGTGKEVFASAIHQAGGRSGKPFVAINCSSFTGDLLESELFGYKAGAFTGALKDKKGLVEEANGGTLFLDEVGEIMPDMQARLLRLLENQSFIKIGSTETTKVNVRIIAATNRDLQKAAETGTFRMDLYYRLSVFNIQLPPLRERKPDIRSLADHYLAMFSAKMGVQKMQMDKGFIEALEQHPWKGNIRELKNLMERVVILADSASLSNSLLPPEFNTDITDSNPIDLATVEKQHIKKILAYTGGNKTETARLLGIGLTTLYRKLDEYTLNQ
ncbi:sigma-54-dependent transcriptional regulator [Mucilaginibacter auburnensis]|uniref:DNA-binding NtrC family response regulator n=1 Tax=Mucilaginibacter auburnensis TaxID=1457233 RepID=A0A2H9VT80_9SPHI|nr:sigma-54 dependent transcriptional regulator [Mucilaginibacter auburnensis]PJJ83992.1 DNA-binding NtrC family response regulator [Mucilaginibacter auburnensis]